MSEEPKALTIPERMVNATKGMFAERTRDSKDFQRALEIAETSKGVVIADEGGARLNAEAALLLVKGIRAEEAAAKDVLSIPKLIVAKLAEFRATNLSKLKRALEERNAAKVAWDAEVGRRAQAEFAAQQRDHAASVAAARAEAPEEFFVGLDEPVAPPAPPKLVTTTVGKQTTREILKAEIANLADVDPAFVDLRIADATAHFRREVKQGNAEAPGLVSQKGDPAKERFTKGRVLGGCRFWLEPSVQNSAYEHLDP